MTARFVHETPPQRVVFASFEAAEHVPGDIADLARKAAITDDRRQEFILLSDILGATAGS